MIRPRPTFSLLLACVLLAGCRSALGPGTEPDEHAPETVSETSSAAAKDLADTLLQLAESAMASGDLELAESRLDRALVADPNSAGAHLALARIAERRRQPDRHRAHLEKTLALDDSNVDALAMLAALEQEDGNRERAIALWTRAVRHGPDRPESHAALARLTGPAPGPRRSPPAEGLESVLALAAAYPYDPWVNLEAARALAAVGEQEAAAQILQNSLWFADRDLEVLDDYVALLKELDPSWKSRRIVEVRCYADESVRADPAWRWRLRRLWRNLSRALDPILATAFVPVSIEGFRSKGESPDLISIDAAALRQAKEASGPGIRAIFTQRSVPHDGRAWRSGQAELLGERMVIRLVPDTTMSRTMVHEMIHLYGGIHLSTEFDSLMNPSGGSYKLDDLNLMIALLTRERRFENGAGIDKNVLQYSDADKLLTAYLKLLELNLQPRNRDLLRANQQAATSKEEAAQITSEATELDFHMAQVSGFLGKLYLRKQRLDDAQKFYELAAKLYGLGTVDGQAARDEVRRIRQVQRRQQRQTDAP